MKGFWRWILILLLIFLSLACEVEDENALMIEEAAQNTTQEGQ